MITVDVLFRNRHWLVVVVVSWLCCCPAGAGELQRLKVFVLAGQSNMQGHAKVSTFEHVGMDPATRPMLADMLGPDGKPKVCERVWISSLGCGYDPMQEQVGQLTAGFGAAVGGPKIGPEFTFGIYLEKSTDAPILLIKTSWGGRSLNTDFRPPGAGPYVFNESQIATLQKQGKDLEAARSAKDGETGLSYRLMIDHVQRVLADLPRVVPGYDPVQGYDLAGFVWFQGWNDMVDSSTYPQRDQPGGYDDYSKALVHLIRDVRRDLNTPQLPLVIGVLGVGGPTSEYGPDELRYKATHQNFRDAMAAPALLPEFQGRVVAVLTEQYWDRELKATRRKEADARQRAQTQAMERGLSPAEGKSLVAQMLAEDLTDHERLVLEKGVSNQEYHYLGSAKIIGSIGKGLAEAMLSLHQQAFRERRE
jgi:Carbohydrate esterase, sialic acid-specific acetylesterase